MGYAYDESPFVPLRTTTSGNSRPTEAMQDAEIAKLREERAIHLASIAEHSKQLAAARAALDAYKSPEAAHNLAMRAIEESHRANRAEAALDGERDACDNGVAALTAILDAWSIGWMPHLRNAVRKFVTEQQNRRAAEAKGEPK